MAPISRAARKRGKTLTSKEAVYQCIVDMYCSNPPMPVTKNTVAAEMGLPFSTVDVHIGRLYEDDCRLLKPMPGHYVPKDIKPNRAVTTTAVPGGGCKVEVGDQVVDLTTWEAGIVVEMLLGYLRRMDPRRLGKTIVPQR